MMIGRIATLAAATMFAAGSAAMVNAEPESQDCEQVLSHFVPEEREASPCFIMPSYVYMGRPDAWEGAPDFWWRYETQSPWEFIHGTSDGTPKLHVRSLVIGDVGDSPDLVIRRAGPKGAPYNTDSPEPTSHGMHIGALQWMTWGGRCEEGEYGWKAGCHNQGRVAGIGAVAIGEQTGQSRAGRLLFRTTPLGNPGNPVRRMVITETGAVHIQGSQPSARDIAIIRDPESPGETSLSLGFVADGQWQRVRAVEVGSADSCGTGYRCLRVPN